MSLPYFAVPARRSRVASTITLTFLICVLFLTFTTEAAVQKSPQHIPSAALQSPPASTLDQLIPKPVSVSAGEGVFTLTDASVLAVLLDNTEVSQVAAYLADRLRPATGFNLPIVGEADAPDASIFLRLPDDESALGDEGYHLSVTPETVTLTASKPEGLFRGIQTLRQLLPPQIESASPQSVNWTIPAAEITDSPRFVWRGAMLDVSRHFFDVEDVEHFLDEMAAYKLNRLHLHLSDDQGWRIAINAYPDLTAIGGSTAVDGDHGGYYTQDEYAHIVAYAGARYITIVPEIDMPGHTNAALASYADLNCDGIARSLYTGTEVGFSSICTSKPITYTFLDDVIGEIAALTPGAYFHMGGDESHATALPDYIDFVNQVQTIVAQHGKQVVGWEEIAQAHLLPGSVVQHWNSNLAQAGVDQGAQVVMSPASLAYMDMKYTGSTPLGLDWAGLISVEKAYSWDPASQVPGVGEASILGIEAPLWSETLITLDDIEYMAFPRLIGYAELGWSPADGRSWDEYKNRLAAQGTRLATSGINFYRSPDIDWQG